MPPKKKKVVKVLAVRKPGKKKKKAKGKPLRGFGNKRVGVAGAGKLFGGRIDQLGAPISIGNIVTRSQLPRMQGVTDKEGGNGVMIVGTEMMSVISGSAITAAGVPYNGCFYSAQYVLPSANTANAQNSIGINPTRMMALAINSRLTAISMNFSRFRFRRLKLTYVTSVPTNYTLNSNGVGLAMCYNKDPLGPWAYASNNAICFASVMEVAPAVSGAVWTPMSIEMGPDVLGKDLYFIDIANAEFSATDSDYRQALQGAVTFVTNNPPTVPGSGATVVNWGFLQCDYECELYGSRVNIDSALSVTEEAHERKRSWFSKRKIVDEVVVERPLVSSSSSASSSSLTGSSFIGSFLPRSSSQAR